MPHPVGGAMGVTLCTAAPHVRETRFDITYQIFIRQLHADVSLAVVL